MQARHWLILLLICLPTYNVVAGSEPLPGGKSIADCNKARDSAQCEARRDARIACQHRRGGEKRQCMDARKITPQCMADNDRVACSQKERAAYLCRKEKDDKFRQCMDAQERKFVARL